MADCARVITVEGVDLIAPGTQADCSYLLITPAELSHLQVNPFHLTLEEGALISGAIAAIWALAWACKALVRALNTDGESINQP